MIAYLWDDLGGFTMIGVIACLLSFMIVIGFLYDRDSNAAIARSKPRQISILVSAVGFFVSVGLGLLGVPAAIGLTFWFLATCVLIGGVRVAMAPIETLLPAQTELEGDAS